MDAYQEGWEDCKMQILDEMWALHAKADELAGDGVSAKSIGVTKITLQGVIEYIPKIACPPVSSR